VLPWLSTGIRDPAPENRVTHATRFTLRSTLAYDFEQLLFWPHLGDVETFLLHLADDPLLDVENSLGSTTQLRTVQ